MITTNDTTAVRSKIGFGGGTGDIEEPIAESEYVPARTEPPNQLPIYVTGPIRRRFAKIGRNELCPCGSKMKYKFCHGKKAR